MLLFLFYVFLQGLFIPRISLCLRLASRCLIGVHWTQAQYRGRSTQDGFVTHHMGKLTSDDLAPFNSENTSLTASKCQALWPMTHAPSHLPHGSPEGPGGRRCSWPPPRWLPRKVPVDRLVPHSLPTWHRPEWWGWSLHGLWIAEIRNGAIFILFIWCNCKGNYCSNLWQEP